MLMARSSVGKDVKAEKSKFCEWVKLPAPSIAHMHPSLLGAKEFPDAGGAGGASVAAKSQRVAETETEMELRMRMRMRMQKQRSCSCQRQIDILLRSTHLSFLQIFSKSNQ